MQTTNDPAEKENLFLLFVFFQLEHSIQTKYFSITAFGSIFGLSLTLIFPMIRSVSKIWDLILFVFRSIATYCEIKTV